MWNRRQREIWLDRQLQDLQAAREAYVKGTASPEQLEILKNEKIGEIEKKLKKEADEQKLWNRTKRFLFQGLKKEDTPGAVVNSNSGAVEGAASSSYGILEAVNAKRAEETTSSSQTQHITSPQQIHPGALDVLASNAETTAKQSVKSWTSWVWGR